MVLAGRVHRDVADEDEFLVSFVEGRVENVVRVRVQPGEHFAVCPCDASRGGVEQTFPIGVLTDRDEQFPDRGFGSGLIEGPAGSQAQRLSLVRRSRGTRSGIQVIHRHPTVLHSR